MDFLTPENFDQKRRYRSQRIVVIYSDKTRNPPADWCFEVTNIVKSGETYNPIKMWLPGL